MEGVGTKDNITRESSYLMQTVRNATMKCFCYVAYYNMINYMGEITMDEIDMKVQEVIMDAYNVRPSTAYELMAIVKRFAEMAKTEYEYGKQDSTKQH